MSRNFTLEAHQASHHRGYLFLLDRFRKGLLNDFLIIA